MSIRDIIISCALVLAMAHTASAEKYVKFNMVVAQVANRELRQFNPKLNERWNDLVGHCSEGEVDNGYQYVDCLEQLADAGLARVEAPSPWLSFVWNGKTSFYQDANIALRLTRGGAGFGGAGAYGVVVPIIHQDGSVTLEVEVESKVPEFFEGPKFVSFGPGTYVPDGEGGFKTVELIKAPQEERPSEPPPVRWTKKMPIKPGRSFVIVLPSAVRLTEGLLKPVQTLPFLGPISSWLIEQRLFNQDFAAVITPTIVDIDYDGELEADEVAPPPPRDKVHLDVVLAHVAGEDECAAVPELTEAWQRLQSWGFVVKNRDEYWQCLQGLCTVNLAQIADEWSKMTASGRAAYIVNGYCFFPDANPAAIGYGHVIQVFRGINAAICPIVKRNRKIDLMVEITMGVPEGDNELPASEKTIADAMDDMQFRPIKYEHTIPDLDDGQTVALVLPKANRETERLLFKLTELPFIGPLAQEAINQRAFDRDVLVLVTAHIEARAVTQKCEFQASDDR